MHRYNYDNDGSSTEDGKRKRQDTEAAGRSRKTARTPTKEYKLENKDNYESAEEWKELKEMMCEMMRDMKEFRHEQKTEDLKNVYIHCDLTYKEREIQKKIKKHVEEERKAGKTASMGYQKLVTNGQV
ncbi:hypothetical protein FQA39_LY05542 [Lamprigera yunnana]|nr:hypothetical protein FQA39_LY05542 [Lamprigera yunnana]